MILPDIRQQGSYDCGIAAVRCVLRFYRKRWADDYAVRLNTNEIDGTDPRNIEIVFRFLGFGVVSGNMDAYDLRHHTGLGRPVITLVQRNGIGHYCVVSSLDGGRIHYQDPADGPISASLKSFVKNWSDVDRLGAIYDSFGIVAWIPRKKAA